MCRASANNNYVNVGFCCTVTSPGSSCEHDRLILLHHQQQIGKLDQGGEERTVVESTIPPANSAAMHISSQSSQLWGGMGVGHFTYTTIYYYLLSLGFNVIAVARYH